MDGLSGYAHRPLAFMLRYLRQRFPTVQTWQVSAVGKRDYETPEGIRVVPASVLLKQLV